MKFQFSIRDLLLVTAIAGLAIGWWLDHRLQSSWRREVEDQRDVIGRMYDRAAEHLDRHT